MINYGDYSAWILSGMTFSYFFLFGVLFLALYLVKTKVSKKLLPLAFSLTFVLFEYIKSETFLIAFPWALGGQIFYRIDVMTQVVDLFGIWFFIIFIILFSKYHSLPCNKTQSSLQFYFF